MFELAGRAIEYLSDLPPAAFIGALLLALAIAATTAATYRWLARRKPDASMLLVCLILLANLACILAAAVFVQSKVPTVRVIERGGRPPRDRIINLHNRFARPDDPAGSGEASAQAPW
jgi:predicted PurR-regulated permease PerM